MTDTATPKKSYKNLFVVIAIVLGLFGMDMYKFHFVFGTDVTVTDSTIVVTPTVDTTVVAPVVDTTKADTTKK